MVDGESLSGCPFPVRFGAVGRDSLEFHWLDARRPDAIRVLLASSTVFPFVHDGVAIDGVTYIDGGYREGICFRRLRRDHPDARLLLVLNDSEYESVVRRVTVSAALRLRDERLAAAWLDTFDRTPPELAEALGGPARHGRPARRQVRRPLRDHRSGRAGARLLARLPGGPDAAGADTAVPRREL